MKTFKKIFADPVRMIGLAGISALLWVIPGCGPTIITERTVVRQEVAPPPWAPVYEDVQQVHYYYLPDVELYYDVWRQQYVYYNMGNWVYTATIPAYCAGYNVNEAFVVVLDRNISDPWRHHHNYVTLYPKYYYRSKYNDWNDRGNNGPMRGYNENARTVIYHSNRTSGSGRTEQVVRNPSVNRSNQEAQPQNQNRRDQYQRTYPATSGQPAQTPTRRNTYTPAANTTTPVTNTQTSPVTRRDSNPANTNPSSGTPVTRRDNNPTGTNSSTAAPVVRESRTESNSSGATAPVRTERTTTTQPAPDSRRTRTEVSRSTEKVQQSQPTDTKKKDDKNTRSRR